MSDYRGGAMRAALAAGCRAPALHPGECPCARFGVPPSVGGADPLKRGVADLLDPDAALSRYAFNLGVRAGRLAAAARDERACPACGAPIGEWCKAADGTNMIHKERR